MTAKPPYARGEEVLGRWTDAEEWRPAIVTSVAYTSAPAWRVEATEGRTPEEARDPRGGQRVYLAYVDDDGADVQVDRHGGTQGEVRRVTSTTPTGDASLTDAEHSVIDLLGQAWAGLCQVTADGPTRDQDLAEMAAHVHALQNAVLAQAAARAYPQTYRLMGSTQVKPPLLDSAQEFWRRHATEHPDCVEGSVFHTEHIAGSWRPEEAPHD